MTKSVIADGDAGGHYEDADLVKDRVRETP